MKSSIISLRKQIFNNLKSKAYSYEGAGSAELIEYKINQELLSQREFSKSTIDELLSSVENSSVTYIGDFHTFDQNIRNILRIIKYLIQNENKCLVALEMVDAKYQLYIDSYLDGHITDLEFLESIEYHDSWRFPWSHYKLIFELAKENEIRIVGINTSGTLKERDDFASKLIANILNKDLVSKVLVLYGELHISKNKIPRSVAQGSNNLNQTIIHQNLDEVYWKQIEGNHSYEIIKFQEDEFCINSAPPWIKYESMIYWYENLCDDPDFDIHEYIIENGKKIFSDDTQDNFSILCEQLSVAANLNIKPEAYNDFNLYDHTSLEHVEDKILEIKNEEEVQIYEFMILRGLSFKLPLIKAYYCSSYSVNRLAYLCGMHLFSIHLPERLGVDLKTNRSEFIVFKIYEHMYAYFFSKVINPHRKCPLYKDFILEQHDKINQINLEIVNTKSLKHVIEEHDIFDITLSSIEIGHFLGEYLYNQIVVRNSSEFDLNVMLNNTKADDFSFQSTKNKILKGFNYKDHLKRYF